MSGISFPTKCLRLLLVTKVYVCIIITILILKVPSHPHFCFCLHARVYIFFRAKEIKGSQCETTKDI